MLVLTMKNLERCFNQAKELKMNFVVIKVEVEGFPETEIIINPIKNVDTKLEYYKKTYDDNLNHKHANGIKITGFAFGDDLEKIEEDLT